MNGNSGEPCSNADVAADQKALELTIAALNRQRSRGLSLVLLGSNIAFLCLYFTPERFLGGPGEGFTQTRAIWSTAVILTAGLAVAGLVRLHRRLRDENPLDCPCCGTRIAGPPWRITAESCCPNCDMPFLR